MAPTLTSVPGVRTLLGTLNRHEWPARPLATPPPGSGLKPVMGDSGLPFIGYTLQMILEREQLAHRAIERHGPVTWGAMWGTRFVLASGGDAVQSVLVNEDKAFSQTAWEFMAGPFFHRGLLMLDFDEHHTQRRVMQQAFTQQRLAGYLARMEPMITARVATWPADGGPIEFHPAMKQLSLDIATDLFMGGEVGECQHLTDAFETCLLAGTAMVRFPVPGLAWSKGLAARKVLEKHFRDSLPAKRADGGDDLFAALCHARSEEGDTYTDDDIVNQMIFLMMAAHDTSTITTTATAYHLAKHPGWQDRVRAECLAVGDGQLSTDDLKRLPSLDLVMNESMRLVAPVNSLVRQTVRDTEIAGHYVPRGTLIGVILDTNHRSSEYWTNPDEFDPERFADDRREDKAHRFAFLPFGGGAHKCLGLHFGTLEIKTVIHRLLTRYRLEVDPGYELTWDKTALYFPPDGLPMRLLPLKQTAKRRVLPSAGSS